MTKKSRSATVGVMLLLLLLLGLDASDADWTATCTSGCVCKWADGKKVAECINAGYTTVPQHLSPEIQVLDLKGNRLDVLVSQAFSSVGLVNLQRIHLRNCSIRSVDKHAFHDLSIMIEVDLSANQLKRLHPDTFATNERLRVLSLSHNPLHKLEAHQFPALAHLKLLELVDCALEMVDKKAFMHLSVLETLKLNDNGFRTLKAEVFAPLMKLKSLDLHDNPWNCDCRLVALRDSLSEANLNSTLTLCHEPQQLKGRAWSRLPTADFACRPVVEMAESRVQGRLGFDVTFSCRVGGSPPPAVWWVLQDRQTVNASTGVHGQQFVISSSALPSLQPGQWHHEETQHWSNLTLKRISQSDVGQYRCVARNKGGQVEGNATLHTPLAPIIVILEEETGLPYAVVVSIASVIVILLLMGLLLLTICLCRRSKSRRQRSASSSKHNGNGSLKDPGAGGAGGEQEKSLLDRDMDPANHQLVVYKTDPGGGGGGYQPVSQTELDHSQQRPGSGSSTYIAGERFDNRVPESLARHLLLSNGLTVRDVDASHIHADGSFYPDLLDIPHRVGRGGGSPSTNSGASTVPEVFPLNAAHLTGHPSYSTPDYRLLAVHPPLQFTDSVNSTSSLLPAGSGSGSGSASRPGYVTLPRRPRPRIPSWTGTGQSWSGTGTPPVSSPVPAGGELQPLYDTIGPRVTADGSSSSALSLNKIAGLTPAMGMGSPNSSLRSCATLGRGHKISLPAYYVPIEEVDVPIASSPNPCHRASPSTSTPNNAASYPAAEILSPIPPVVNGQRKKTAPAVAPKPAGLVNSRRSSYAEDFAASPVKVAPKPPPKPKKQRLSMAGSERLDEEDAPFEDEGEDGTEV